MRSSKKSMTATRLGGKKAKPPLWKRLPRGAFVVAMAVVLLLLILLGILLVPTLLAQLEGKISIQTLQQGQVTRSYRVYRPTGILPHPGLVIMLSGETSGFVQEIATNFDAQADRLGWLVVYPEILSEGWEAYGCCSHQGASDVAFLSTVIDQLEATAHVDPTRVYISGISRGGMMAYRLGCELSTRIAAIAPVAGNMADQNGQVQGVACHPQHPVSVLAIHGTADPEVPLKGGRSLVQQESIAYAPFNDVIAKWRELDHCGSARSVTRSGSPVTTWTCQGGSVVSTLVIPGGVHTWPGTFLGVLVGVLSSGPQSYGPEVSVNASQVIADFFAAHQRVQVG
ncbi:MAG TPA: PHB depolymerase family esterase [Ktedonobacteraceae bacterium]|nr:PHB depolymerase family esterase [Ktedonobacteraceae bacterium]